MNFKLYVTIKRFLTFKPPRTRSQTKVLTIIQDRPGTTKKPLVQAEALKESRDAGNTEYINMFFIRLNKAGSKNFRHWL